jgi:DNA-binding NtrC family response regulator
MFLERCDYDVVETKSAEEAVKYLEKSVFDLVISDLKLYERDGLWLLRFIRRKYPDTKVLLMSAYGDVDTAVNALKEGAIDFVEKPFTPPGFIERCRKALEAEAPSVERGEVKEVRNVSPAAEKAERIVGSSYTVKKIKDLLMMVDSLPEAVLLSGESGCGKELLAREIHKRSWRRDYPFVVVNCSALPCDLLDSELFGSYDSRGVAVKTGVVSKVSKGVMFLDDVSSLDQRMQIKLLDLLEGRRFRMAGHMEEAAFEGLIICGTACSLEDLAAEGEFRQDLYYRISVVHLSLEPLRERLDDIPDLMLYFLDMYARKHGKKIEGFEKSVVSAFQACEWPGNIRELRNAVERSVLFCAGSRIELSHIPESVREPKPKIFSTSDSSKIMPLRDVERHKIIEALKFYRGNKATTARALGIGRNTLWRKLKEYQINDEEFSS